MKRFSNNMKNMAQYYHKLFSLIIFCNIGLLSWGMYVLSPLYNPNIKEEQLIYIFFKPLGKNFALFMLFFSLLVHLFGNILLTAATACYVQYVVIEVNIIIGKMRHTTAIYKFLNDYDKIRNKSFHRAVFRMLKEIIQHHSHLQRYTIYQNFQLTLHID